VFYACEHVFDMLARMDPARFVLALPAEPELLARLDAELASQGDPAISVDRSSTTVVAFEANTADLMLRSRVIEALEVAAGPRWQLIARPID
jgi:hypothetical protein